MITGISPAGWVYPRPYAGEAMTPRAEREEKEAAEICGCRSQNECCAPGMPGCRRDELPRSLERSLSLADEPEPYEGIGPP